MPAAKLRDFGPCLNNRQSNVSHHLAIPYRSELTVTSAYQLARSRYSPAMNVMRDPPRLIQNTGWRSAQRQPISGLRHRPGPVQRKIGVFLQQPLIVRQQLHRVVRLEPVAFDRGIHLSFQQPH